MPASMYGTETAPTLPETASPAGIPFGANERSIMKLTAVATRASTAQATTTNGFAGDVFLGPLSTHC